jgi:hypothetical protein
MYVSMPRRISQAQKLFHDFVKKSQTPNQGEKKLNFRFAANCSSDFDFTFKLWILGPPTQEKSLALILDCSRTRPPTR